MSTLFSQMFLRMSEMAPLPVEWVWEGLVPKGNLTLLTGDPGIGKSLVALQLAAMVTRGVTDPRELTPGLLTGESVSLAATIPAIPFSSANSKPANGKPSSSAGNKTAGAVSSKPAGGASNKPAGGATSNPASGAKTNPAGSGAASPGDRFIPPQTGVLVLTAADQPCQTVLPRLIAAGADPSQVFFLNSHFVTESDDKYDDSGRPVRRLFRLSQDIGMLEWCLMELCDEGIDVGLIVIDSIDQYLGTDEKKSVRIEVVAKLAKLAATANCAILITANTSMKAGSRGGTVVYQELMNTARSVLMVAPDLEDLDRRLVLPIKHNLTGRPPGLSFTVIDGALKWGTEPIDLSGDEYRLQSRRNEKMALVSDDGQEIQRAANWLKDELAQEAAPSELVQRRASQVHLSYGTLRRAFKLIGGKVRKQKNQWFWSLPEDEAEMDSSVTTGNVLVI